MDAHTVEPAHAPRVRLIRASPPIIPPPEARARPYRPESIPWLVRLGRLLSIVPVAVVFAGQPHHERGDLIVAAAVGVHALARTFIRRRSTRMAWVDLAFAALVVAVTGGPSSAFAPYGMITVIDGALLLGPGRGAIAGLAVAMTAASLTFASVVDQFQHEPYAIVPWFALFPAVGFAGGLGGRIRRDGERPNARIVTETNRALSSLFRLARTMPGGLDTSNVASAALEQVRESLRSPAVAVIAGTGADAILAGAFGLADRDAVAHHAEMLDGVRSPRVMERWELPTTLAAALGPGGAWYVAPLRRRGDSEGTLIASAVERTPGDLHLLEAIAIELAGALENARLFERVRRLSIDEERSRVGRDLHDGLAQALTHIRLELELLARSDAPPETLREEASRLAEITARALADVRATVAGLRSPASDGGLAASLRAHIATLRGPSVPPIRLECGQEVVVEPHVQDELFRIAQEAISNASRHAAASEIRVRIGVSNGWAMLVVDDDGVGISEDDADSGGVGLQAMRERAARVGARVSVRRRAAGGTSVEVARPVPVEVPA